MVVVLVVLLAVVLVMLLAVVLVMLLAVVLVLEVLRGHPDQTCHGKLCRDGGDASFYKICRLW